MSFRSVPTHMATASVDPLSGIWVYRGDLNSAYDAAFANGWETGSVCGIINLHGKFFVEVWIAPDGNCMFAVFDTSLGRSMPTPGSWSRALIADHYKRMPDEDFHELRVHIADEQEHLVAPDVDRVTYAK